MECDQCGCYVLYEDRAEKGSWYIICEWCIGENEGRAK